MRFYKFDLINNQVDLSGTNTRFSFIVESVVYVAVNGYGKDEWTEIGLAEYLSAGGINVNEFGETSLDQIEENQLIIMDALATIFETMIGGGS